MVVFIENASRFYRLMESQFSIIGVAFENSIQYSFLEGWLFKILF